MNQSLFGVNLRRLRIDKGLTQEQLADKISVTANAVGQFERGKILPNYETVARIINALDIDANLLFSREPVDYPDEAKWIAGLYVNLSSKEKQVVGKVLEEIAKIFLDGASK